MQKGIDLTFCRQFLPSFAELERRTTAAREDSLRVQRMNETSDGPSIEDVLTVFKREFNQ